MATADFSANDGMMAEAGGASPMAPAVDESEISPQEAAVLRHEADYLAAQLNDAAKAADALAADPSIPDDERAAMAIRAQTMRGQATALNGMHAGALRTNLPIIAASAAGMMAVAKSERNDAMTSAAQDSAQSAAIMGTSDNYYSAQQFDQRAQMMQDDFRRQLEASGMYTQSTDAYLNSSTEAQWRSFEQDLQTRYPDIDPELLHKVKFQQLNAEAKEAQAQFEKDDPALAQKMKGEYGGLLKHAERDDVPDADLRHSLAIVDANKFLDLADKNPVLAKAARGEAISEEERASLNDEQKRALAFFESDEYKNMTPEQREAFKRDVGLAADKIEANKKAAAQGNEKEFSKFQQELKKMEEDMRKEGKSEAEIKEAVEARLKEWGDRFERDPKEKLRDREQDKQQAPDPAQPQLVPGTNHAAVDQNIQIAPDSQSVAASPVPTSPKAEMLAQLGFKPEQIMQIMGIVSVAQQTGVGGMQDHSAGDPPGYQSVASSNHAMEALLAAENARSTA